MYGDEKYSSACRRVLEKKADEVFSELGTTTNEAIKIFLKMSVNSKGFPFELKLPEVTTLQEIVEQKMLNISEDELMDAYTIVTGNFRVDDEFGVGVVDETITVEGLFENDELKDLVEAHVKIVDEMATLILTNFIRCI